MANISVAVPTASGSQIRKSSKPGIFRKLAGAIMQSRQLKADKEIAETLSWRRGAFPKG